MLITTVAAALLSVTGAPQPTATPTPIAAPVAPAPVVVAAPARANPRVCLVDEVTGSRIPLRTCKSLDQWRALGLDPLAKR